MFCGVVQQTVWVQPAPGIPPRPADLVHDYIRNVGGDPFFVRRAKGCRIYDVDDRCMIDYVGTWGPAILGHAPPAVIDGLLAEAARFGSTSVKRIYGDWTSPRLICVAADYTKHDEHAVRQINRNIDLGREITSFYLHGQELARARADAIAGGADPARGKARLPTRRPRTCYY